MAKSGGLGMLMAVGEVNLSNDTGSIQQIGTPRGVIDQTGIDKFALERLLTHRDGLINWTSHFNPALAHAKLSDLPTTDQIITVGKASALGAVAASLNAKQVNYDGARNADASVPFTVQAVGNQYGLEWGNLVTAGQRNDTSATNGSGVDFTAGASFGLQAYCHLFAFTGTSVTIKLQESSDNGSSDAYADVAGGSFGALTTPGGSRIQTARNQTVERWLRVVTTGTFSVANFLVTVIYNRATVNF